MKNLGGRPLKFQSEENLIERINAYFDYCDRRILKRIVNKNGELVNEISTPYSITGLASFLKVDRHTLVNYEGKSDGFFTAIKDAKAKIEASYEERGLIGEANPAVTIFTLKNNFNWKDRQEQDITTLGQPLYLPTEIIEKNKLKSSEERDND